jgi:hypothetical protein
MHRLHVSATATGWHVARGLFLGAASWLLLPAVASAYARCAWADPAPDSIIAGEPTRHQAPDTTGGEEKGRTDERSPRRNNRGGNDSKEQEPTNDPPDRYPRV